MGVSELEGMLMVSLVRMEELMSVVETMSMSSNSAQLLIRSLPFVVGVWLKGILRWEVLRCWVHSRSAQAQSNSTIGVEWARSS